jgi:carbon-monoxide dehydrogenase medium subunit
MKPPPFAYVAPDSLEEAIACAARYEADGKILAGGQSLMPVLNFRLAHPAVLIDLNRVKDLSGIAPRPEGGLSIGAMTRHRAVEWSDDVRRHCPLMSVAIAHVGHVQIRNRGTIGGSLSHADPAAELPAVVLACDAELCVAGPNGSRAIAAEDFFQGVFTTAIDSGEILTEIRLPPWPGNRRFGFQEINRRHGDFALAGAAVWLDTEEADRCTAARLVLFGVSETPLRARMAEQYLIGQTITPARITEAASLAIEGFEPTFDIHASAEYRREVGSVMMRRALQQAAMSDSNARPAT